MLLLFLLALIISGYSLPLNPLEESIDYRIHSDVEISNYDLTLTLDNNWTTEKKFTGKVIITFEVKSESEKLELHAKDLIFDQTDIVLAKEQIFINLDLFVFNNDTDILTLKASKNAKIEAGTYTLTISYIGLLREDMSGFYISTYNSDDSSKTVYLASTQFESTSARKAFPCFDEPQYKASFTVTIECEDKYKVWSNMQPDTEAIVKSSKATLKSTKFVTTPKMSTYLLAFVVSEFDCIESVDKFHKVCSRPSVKNSGNFALETAPQVLNVMKKYTNFDYANSGMTHLQQVAIPDFAAGAMENWGLVTYRETALLWNEDDYSASAKQRVGTVVAHELSHQWFGDLVTLQWWEDTFLNEGFATYFEYHATNQIYSEWELDKQFVVEQLQTAFAVDSDLDSKPLHLDVNTPGSISSHFDSISYNKGGSIIRMVTSFVNNFESGLQNYIDQNKFQNTQPKNLWDVFEITPVAESPLDLNTIMDTWINKAGYPIISVQQSGDNIILTQKQFLNSGTSELEWYVPITYTTSKGINNDVQWLIPSKNLTINVTNDVDWVIVNNQQKGYYRVDYDKTLLDKLSTLLKDTNKASKIDVLNKAQIVDDLLNLAKIGKKDYTDVFNFLRFLQNEDSYYPWYAAFREFTNILKRIDAEKINTDLKTFFLTLMETLLKKTEINNNVPENHVEILRKELALTWACKLNNEECIQFAKEQFATFKEDTTKKVNPNFRSVVYCSAIANSDRPEEDFKVLWTLYKTVTNTEQTIILKGLGCLTNEEQLKNYLSEAIKEDSIVRKQDGKTAFTAVIDGSKSGATVVLNFLKDKWDDIRTRLGDSTLESIISSAANAITNNDQLNILNEIESLEGLPTAIKSTVTESITKVKSNLQTTKTLEDAFEKYFKSGANQNVVQWTTFISTLFVIIYHFI